MSDDRMAQILALTGFIDTEKFVKENPLATLSKEELAALHTRTASLDALYQLSGLISMTSAEMGRRDQTKRRRDALLVAVAALALSLASLAIALFSRRTPSKEVPPLPTSTAPTVRQSAPAPIPAKKTPHRKPAPKKVLEKPVQQMRPID